MQVQGYSHLFAAVLLFWRGDYDERGLEGFAARRHSGDYCDHAEGRLRDLLDAAVAFGYHTFGVSEHVPRFGAQYLYDKEKEMGWTGG